MPQAGGSLFGDVGVVSLVPVVALFGIGILKKTDFSSLPWHLLFLIAGGNMLGVCAMRSGLLEVVNIMVHPFIQSAAPHHVLVICVVLMAFLNLFIKHTVTALVFLPFLSRVALQVLTSYHKHGGTGDSTSASSIILSSVLMISGSMALPISSFPNMNSLLAENAEGDPYLNGWDFVLPGTLLSAVVALVLLELCPLECIKKTHGKVDATP
jgi:phosphate transporter